MAAYSSCVLCITFKEQMKDNRILIFEPKPGASADEVMQVLRMFVFQTYPPEIRTRENMLALFDSLPESAKRHFQVQPHHATPNVKITIP